MRIGHRAKNFLFYIWLQPWFPQRIVRAVFIQYYKWRGRVPWSLGFVFYQWRSIKNILASQQQLESFAEGAPLLPMYGYRLDERVVELPWLFSRISSSQTRFLDAGSALNHDVTIARLMACDKDLTILTLMPERWAFWKQGISYHFDDVRAMPFRDEWFDEIACISTLEHVGMDNLNYGEAAQSAIEREDFQIAAIDLWRVLKKGGRLFITVPFGRRQDVFWNNVLFMQQFDQQMLEKLLACFEGGITDVTFYQYSPGGWQVSTLEACADVEYFNMHESTGPAADFAAAARAVACLEIRKES